MSAETSTQPSSLVRVGETTLLHLVLTRASGSEIARHLDALAPERRVAEMLAVKGRGVKYLYDAAEGADPVPVDEFVPPTAKGTVIYEGRNSLFLFSRFQKRFQRLEDGRVIGYNHQAMSWFTGPGYFHVREPSGTGKLGSELLFDYTEDVATRPEGWPRFSPNTRGFARLVYGNMKDYCRRVARGVVVGKAYRLEEERDAYFSLTLP